MELISNVLEEYNRRFRVTGGEGFDELKVRVLVDKAQMNNVKST